jgi:DNA excision repair protein ERCC-5
VAQHAEENGISVPAAATPKMLIPEPTSVRKYTIPSNPQNEVSSREIPEKRNEESNRKEKETTTKSLSAEGENRRLVLESIEALEQEWSAERKRQSREMDTVTDEMRAEVMHLLQLFGIPYVEAPAEAEAQCVMLEKLGLVDGIVTEDSDAFVFGGQVIYKNIFDDKKYVEVYNAKDAEAEMNLSREGMVGLAMVMGGDYTEGMFLYTSHHS